MLDVSREWAKIHHPSWMSIRIAPTKRSPEGTSGKMPTTLPQRLISWFSRQRVGGVDARLWVKCAA